MRLNHVIDEIEAQILKALLKDARASFSDIAKDCKVSVTTISKKYNRLKQMGVIVGTALRADMTKFGFKHDLAIDMNAESGQEANIMDTVRKLPRFYACYQTVGRYDMHAAVGSESLAEIDQIRNTLKKTKGVLRVVITASIDKSYFFPENLIIEPTEDSHNG